MEAEAGESLHSDTTAALFPLFLSVGISLPQPPLSTEEEEEEASKSAAEKNREGGSGGDERGDSVQRRRTRKELVLSSNILYCAVLLCVRTKALK